MQYTAEDRIDDQQLNDWLKELVEATKEQEQLYGQEGEEQQQQQQEQAHD